MILAFSYGNICFWFLQGNVIIGNIASFSYLNTTRGRPVCFAISCLINGLSPNIGTNNIAAGFQQKIDGKINGHKENEKRQKSEEQSLFPIHNFLNLVMKKPSIPVSKGKDRKYSLLNRKGRILQVQTSCHP